MSFFANLCVKTCIVLICIAIIAILAFIAGATVNSAIYVWSVIFCA